MIIGSKKIAARFGQARGVAGTTPDAVRTTDISASAESLVGFVRKLSKDGIATL